MRLTENTDFLTQEDVKSFLQVYTIGRERRQILRERLLRLVGELRVTTPGPFEAGCSIAMIENRLNDQMRNVAVLMLKVLDLIDLLPLDSLERKIVEMRHLDGMDWKEITRQLYLSRSYVLSRYSKALGMMLSYDVTCKIVAAWKCERVTETGI